MLLDDGEQWRNIEVSNSYLQENSEVVILRLQKAGVRLAQLLNKSSSCFCIHLILSMYKILIFLSTIF